MHLLLWKAWLMIFGTFLSFKQKAEPNVSQCIINTMIESYPCREALCSCRLPLDLSMSEPSKSWRRASLTLPALISLVSLCSKTGHFSCTSVSFCPFSHVCHVPTDNELFWLLSQDNSTCLRMSNWCLHYFKTTWPDVIKWRRGITELNSPPGTQTWSLGTGGAF